MINQIEQAFNDHIKVAENCKQNLSHTILNICEIVINALKEGNKIILFGNGGSAADAQHLAAEFTGRFVKERKGLPAIALTTDTSALTAIGNDYGFENIFSRQVEALVNKGDVLIGISTSGNSQNVIKAFEKGDEIGTINIALTGNTGGVLANMVKNSIIIPTNVTARIQEMHIFIGHVICQSVDSFYEK
jgi:D-sedoheptulose 7-phosphate isomerase